MTPKDFEFNAVAKLWSFGEEFVHIGCESTEGAFVNCLPVILVSRGLSESLVLCGSVLLHRNQDVQIFQILP